MFRISNCVKSLYPYQQVYSIYITGFAFISDKGRQVCHLCKSSRKYYCYQCNTIIGLTPDQTPNVTLPLHIDMLVILSLT